jgi:hypothetical protein
VDLLLPASGPILRSALLAKGLTDDELRRARRRGDITVLDPGAYASAHDPDLGKPEHRHRLRIAAAVPRVAADAVVSHVSAAVLLGLPVWGLHLRRVNVTRPRRSGGSRSGRLHVHTAGVDPDEILLVDGIAITSPARTVVDIARTATFEQAVAVADAALFRHLLDRAALDGAVERASRRPGAPAARRVVSFADPRSEGVGESRSRVLMARHAVATPVLQWEVTGSAGEVLGRADFGWPDRGWVGEFDGLVKYGRLLRPGEVPADALVAEKRREDAMRNRLRGFSRWIWDDLDDFAAVASRLPR